MSFGENLQFLRKMRNKMTQEELAERMGVSRQTVSRWELNAAYPEMSKVIELCALFSCSMDQLIREDMNVCGEAYSDIRMEWVAPFRYIRYAVVSSEPEEDAIRHVKQWASLLGITEPRVIGWDFPVVSQEQINVFHMHGYAAALLLPDDVTPADIGSEVLCQGKQKYLVITIKEPFSAPFRLIPNAYKTLLTYMKTNGISGKHEKGILDCFEKDYSVDGVDYMDVCIAIE